MSQILVSRWGSDLGLRIPGDMAAGLDLRAGDTLEVRASVDGLLLTRDRPGRKSYRLADVLDSFPSSEERPLVDFGPSKGEEAW